VFKSPTNFLVTAVVFGYFKLDKKNNIVDAVDVDNPPITIHTRGIWIDVPSKALEILSLKGYNIAGSIHAAEHAIISLLPNVVITSLGDVRTECKAPQKEYAKVTLNVTYLITQRETERKRPARFAS
jgi:DEAD/DEAH box helicase domain-containing protein